jgi:hypothetical protein
MRPASGPSLLLSRQVVCLVLFCESVPIATAVELQFQSGAKQTELIELYTSEGCSSCPPAEAWLTKLKTETGLWKDFVPVAFHVDYWDDLGWRDRFATRSFTDRQRAYAAFLRSDSIYTPEFIVNGSEWRGWFNDHQLPKGGTENVGILSATTSNNNTFVVAFRPTQELSSQWEAHLALLGCGVSSRVSAGENSGRKLEHDFVVLDHQRALMKNDAGTARGDVTIHFNSGDAVAQKAVAIWVTRRNQLEPVQATGRWLARP